MADIDRPSLETIYKRMLADMQSRVTSNTRIFSASILNILVIVFSGGMHLMYGYLQAIINNLFADTAILFFLKRIAALFGIKQKSAAFASGSVVFTGVATTVVPTGTELVSSAGLTYVTTEEFTIGITSNVAIIAIEEGTESNITTLFVTMVNPEPDIDDQVAVVGGEIAGGSEEETVEELRLRLFQRLQNPPASGAASDYVRWALSITGVDKVWVKKGADYLGGGSVAIVPAKADLTSVGSVLIDTTQDYIDSVKPIGARFADVIDVVNITVTYSISITPYNAGNEAAIKESLQRLHLLESEPGGTIFLTQIQAAIAETPLVNYEITNMSIASIPGAARDIVTTDFDVATYQTATIAELT